MGARALTSENYNSLRDRVDLVFQCIGAAAANPTGLKSGNMISTIVRNSAGNYTITLTDKWAALLGFQATVLDSANATHYEVTLVSENVASGKTIVMQVWGAAAAAAPSKADLPATATLKAVITVTNSQQKPAFF